MKAVFPTRYGRWTIVPLWLCFHMLVAGTFPVIGETPVDQAPQADQTTEAEQDVLPEPAADEVSEPDVEEAPLPVPPPMLEPGRSVRGEIDLSSGLLYTTYRFSVPEEALRAVIKISSSSGDLDLFALHAGEILDYAMVDAKSISDDYNEELVLSRFGNEGLRSGEYYLDVAYQRDFPPEKNGRPLERIPFNIEVSYQMARSEQTLQAGERVSGILKPEEGMMKLYEVRVRDWDSALRIDISDTTGDIDIFVAYENPVVGPGSAEYSSESLLGREELVIDRSSYPALKGGTYYVLVVDQVSDHFPVLFTMHTSSKPEPPAALLALPPIPDPDDPLFHAVGATVEVVGSEGRGSGCVVSPDGYILTNWHVVRDAENRPSDQVYIAFTLNQRIPPKELFKGRVERYDEELDLALIKINSGRYGQSIPFSYQFPYFRMGNADDLRIGQPISILGYPANGGIGSRVSITLTRGVIAGFETSPLGVYLKTDAEISFGNSGGAVFDAFGELLGLPASISADSEGKLGFILPVSMIPPSWLKIIEGTH